MGTVTEDDQDSRIDQRYASGKGSYDSQSLADQEQAGYDREFNDMVKNSNLGDLKDAEATATPEKSLYNPSSYGGKKSAPGRKLTLNNFRAIVKKRGALAAIGAVLGIVGIGGITLLSPSLLLFQIADTLMNNFNDGHAAISVTSNRAVARKIANTFSDDAAKCGVRCKFNTMSKPLVAKLEAQDFKVQKTDLGGGRYKVTSIEWPGGEPKVTSKAQFEAAMKNPAHAAKFTRAYNVSSRTLMATRFKTAIKTKLGIDKAYKLSGETKEKFKESFRKAIGLPETAPTIEAGKTQTAEEKLQSPRYANVKVALDTAVGRVNKANNVVGLGCAAKNLGNAVNVALKHAQLMTYASFAMTFLNAPHKTKASGIDPLVMSELGDRLTYTEPATTSDGKTNPVAGLTATDSYGYKSAVYGDGGAVPDYASQHRVEALGIDKAVNANDGFSGAGVVLGFISAGLTNLLMNNAPVRTGVVTACKEAASPFAVVMQCAQLKHPAAVLACTAAQLLIAQGVSAAVQAILPTVIAAVITSQLDGIDENTKGVAAGDILYPGAASIFQANASSYGMKAGTADEIKNYTKLATTIQQQDTAIARINAKDQPLDVYNQYSFLGSMAASMKLTSLANQPLTKVASTTASLLPRSLASLTTTTHAGTYQPLPENKANLYKATEECPALNAIGVATDVYCMPAYVTNAAELDASVDDNLSYMIDGKYIDETTGAARTDTDEGKTFQKFLDNCPFRTDPLGETSKSLEDGDTGTLTNPLNPSSDYEWYIGARCSSDEEVVKQFRIYTMNDSVNALVNGEEASTKSTAQLTSTTNSGAGTTTANSGNVNPNGWTFPTSPGAPLVSPFGPRGGGFHTGVDLGVPTGSPFYATRDGVVQTREYNVYTINGDGGAWCPVLGQITDPNQKDIWITHTVDGQTYTSVYAHMSQFLKQTGDVVKAGDLIGYTGGSGCSSGPHVHFEIWQGKATPSIPGPGMLDPWPLITQ